jgi:bifunctional N-acetylglutamate synthase/kinase
VTVAAVQANPADVVLTFLESVGRRAEAELYLRLFRQLPKESFALIVPGAQVTRDGVGALVEQIRFLSDLDLCTPIVLGLFDQGSMAAGAERVARRVTTAGLVPYVHTMDEPELGQKLREELRAARVPIVHFPVIEGDSVEARTVALGMLARDLDTRKIVLLRRRGGLSARGDRPLELGHAEPISTVGGWISVVNLRADRQMLLASKRLSKRDTELLECANRLIELVEPSPLLVSVASPLNLMKELFTVKGAGTLVKRGTPITRHDSYAALDVPRLKALVEASFGRTLVPDFFERPMHAVYLDEQYRGAAIFLPGQAGAYLSKFSVEPQAQGEGMGYDLWQAFSRDFPMFFWRTRHDNPIVPWYLGVADGMARRPQWHVFWRGFEPERIPAAIAEAEAHASDFVT